VSRAKAKLLGIARKYEDLPILPDVPDRQFAVPPSEPTQLVYRGLPLDTLEDLLPGSGAYRQAARVLFAPELRATGRPLTPLHGGHVGPIRGVADFCCKILGNRVFSRWRHSIVKMFYRMRLLHSFLAPAQYQ